MSDNLYVKGNITEKTGGKYSVFANEGIIINSGKHIDYFAPQYTYNEPQDAPERKLQYFGNGWWSSDREGNSRITEALLGDKVYFHLETKNIPDGEKVAMKLYDDDNNEAKEPKDASEKDNDDFLEIVYENTLIEITAGTVYKNKVVRAIIFDNFEKEIANEVDKQLEVYYRCSYMGENVEVPKSPSNYLKIKGMPKIIFVNGQWRLAKYTLGENVGPTQPKKPYWNKGIENKAIDFFKTRDRYNIDGKSLDLNFLESNKFILHYDGSSYAGGDQSGSDRFKKGEKFAQENYAEIVKGLGGEIIYLVSHSEGGAYAAGMANYLFNKGHKIGEHILLSPDEGDEFEINPEIPSYQLLYMFFSSIYNPLMTDVKYFKFKKWDNYYAIVDWVVNEHKIKGITKMGVVHYQETGWTGVHGWTNGGTVFEKVSDLKEVSAFDVIGEHEKEFYSGKSQTNVPNRTKFYRIDDSYIITNCPPLIKI